MKRILALLLVFLLFFSFSACGMYSEEDLEKERSRGYEEGYKDGYNEGTRKGAEFVYDELSPGSIEDALRTIMDYSEGDASWSEMHDAVSQIYRCLENARSAWNYYR